MCSRIIDGHTGDLKKCKINDTSTSFVNKRESKVRQDKTRQGYRKDSSKVGR